MVIIHQIHEYGGAWEDAYDRIVATYLDKQKATEDLEKRRTKAKVMVERAEKCAHCPILYIDSEIELTRNLKTAITAYCDKFCTDILEDRIDCQNYVELWENPSYKIMTEEVLDG